MDMIRHYDKCQRRSMRRLVDASNECPRQPEILKNGIAVFGGEGYEIYPTLFRPSSFSQISGMCHPQRIWALEIVRNSSYPENPGNSRPAVAPTVLQNGCRSDRWSRISYCGRNGRSSSSPACTMPQVDSGTSLQTPGRSDNGSDTTRRVSSDRPASRGLSG